MEPACGCGYLEHGAVLRHPESENCRLSGAERRPVPFGLVATRSCSWSNSFTCHPSVPNSTIQGYWAIPQHLAATATATPPPPPPLPQMQVIRPMHRLSFPCRFPLSFMASATTRWWSPALEQRVSPLIVSPNPPVSRVFRLPCGARNMATITRVKDDESGKPNRLLPISSANVINLPSDNTEKRGAISGVIAGDDSSDKDACWETSEVIYVKHETCGEIVKHTVTEEDGSSTTEDHKGKIVVSDDDELYTVNNVLARSRHRDGAIYRGMDDIWWKKQYCIADRNEKHQLLLTSCWI